MIHKRQTADCVSLELITALFTFIDVYYESIFSTKGEALVAFAD